jgi:hypothetical protein
LRPAQCGCNWCASPKTPDLPEHRDTRDVFDKVAEAGSVQGPVLGQPRPGPRWPSTLVWFAVENRPGPMKNVFSSQFVAWLRIN